MDFLLQDIRFGARLLRRSPGFTVAAVLALALGIGATTAVFTVVDRVVLRPLPYQDPDRLTMLWETNDTKALAHERLSPVNFSDYREQLTHVFADAAAWWYPQVNLTEPGHEPMRVNAVEASGNFFSVIGVQPMLGAGFPADVFFSREETAVISHRLWRQRFNADPSIVGKTVTLSGNAVVVAGVMPPGFQYPGETDVWQRLRWDLHQHSRAAHFMEAIARLKPGVTVDRANTELRALTTRLAGQFASTNRDWRARATTLSSEVVGFFRPALFALFGAAGFLLVIACTNVASLLLARATAREREVAVRAAIGAGRGRLIRQFLTEAIILASIGTALGVTVAIVAVKALVAASPIALPRAADVGVDGRVLLFAIGVAALTAIAFGLVPALFMARGDMNRPLKESGRGSEAGGTKRRARSVLVTAEVALAVMLIVGASLLAHSFQRLVAQDPGFRPSRVVTASVELPALSYQNPNWPRLAEFYSQLLTTLRAQPGVALAGIANFLPLEVAWRMPYFVDGRSQPASEDAPRAQHQSIDEDYFKAIGVPLLKGRLFDAHDTAAVPGVVLVNEMLARREWPNEDPLGKTIISTAVQIGPLGRSLIQNRRYQVIGVVGNVKNVELTREAEPAIYYTFRQFPFYGFHIVAQGDTDAAQLMSAIRASVHQLDPNLPVSAATTLDRVMGDATDRPRALMLLMGVFAALALGLAALGIYSVLSYAVNQRRQELSVRLALGAQPRDVLWLVIRQGLTLTMIGAGVGAFGAFALGRTLSSLLYGVSSGDAFAFTIAVALATLTALAACAIPARRAASIDPLAGLRAD